MVVSNSSPARPITSATRRAAVTVLRLTFLLVPGLARAQGCEPIRFTTPITLGGEGQAYQASGEWRLTLAYRRLYSDEWYIGSQRNDALAPGGSSPVFEIHTGIADVAYAFNDRVRARLSIPVSRGSLARTWADGQHHRQVASGIGDVSVQGEVWMLNPRLSERGNVGLSLGVKAPTGSHSRPSQFYTPTGPVDFPADQTIQPGDGGWAVLTGFQAFRRLTGRSTVYSAGTYMISPRDRTDILGSPGPGPTYYHWSVPDVYSVRAGAALEPFSAHDLSASAALRVDGIPVRDLVGGGDVNTIKRTSRITFIEPGLSYTRERNNFTVSVPWRIGVNRVRSLTEQLPSSPPTANAGGFARFLLFASYSRRL